MNTHKDIKIGGRVRLDAERIAPYLASTGLLAGKDIVDEGLHVQDLSRRNFNFSAKIGTGRGYLLKQVGTGRNAKDFTQLQSEAGMLHLLANDPEFRALAGFVPELRHYDADNGIVVTDLISPGTSLTKYHLNAGKVHFPLEAAKVLAHILATYHRSGTAVSRQGRANAYRNRIPLGLGGYMMPYPGTQAKARDVFVALVKNKPQFQRVRILYDDWLKQTEMFHGDIRLDNFLLTAGEGPTGSLNLKLIDWESAGIGDSIWDVAALMVDYLRFWMLCASNKNAKDAADYWNVAAFPLEHLAPFIGEFWATYSAQRQWDAAEQQRRLAQLASILPVQTLAAGWEFCANLAKDRELPELPPFLHVAVELSDRLEKDWATYSRTWFGLPEVHP